MTKTRQRLLEYASRLVGRSERDIDLLVIHCTELPDLQTARDYGQVIHYPQTGTGNSGHFYIDRDGQTEQWIPLDRTAHHVRGHNENSIGIELVNKGRFPDWFHAANQAFTEPYAEEQIEALCGLINHLEAELPSLQFIAGHEDLDQGLVRAEDNPEVTIRRKLDPGPLFPWEQIMARTNLRREIPGSQKG